MSAYWTYFSYVGIRLLKRYRVTGPLRVLDSKCKNERFAENKGFWCSVVELKYRWLQTQWSSQLETTPNILILIMSDFLRIF